MLLLTDHLFGREQFIPFTLRVFQNVFQMYVCVSFTFGFEGGMRDIIDLFHIIFAHAYMVHVARYFSIIGETLQRWGKWILSH